MRGEDAIAVDGFDLSATVERERPQVPHAAMAVPSMLSYEERALLHWAAREGFGAAGTIVDAGCFLGGSTLALGFGLARAPARTATARVHAYDLFEVGAEWERIYFPADFPFAVGASTLALYKRHVAPVRELVQVHRGDIARARWPGDPISTLFVDIAKTWRTSDPVVEQFFPSLVPGAVVIEQDLVHFGHPWRAIVMESLIAHVEYCGHVHYSSAVYRVRTPIPREGLPTRLLERLSADEALALVDRCADRIGEPIAGQVRVAGARVLADHGEYARARTRLHDLATAYDDTTVPFISDGFKYVGRWIDDLESGAAVVH